MRVILSKLTFNHLVYLVLIALAFTQFYSVLNFMLVFLAACVFILLRERITWNIASFIIILMMVKILEYFLIEAAMPQGNGYVIYGILILVDVLVVSALIFRLSMCRWLQQQFFPRSRNKFVYTNADMLLGGIYLFYLLVDVLAIVEHGLRNLDDFGLTKSQWLYENARVVWRHFPTIKHVLNMLEFVVVLATSFKYFRQARQNA